MAITSGFFNSVDGDRRYNAEQMSTYFEGLVSDGIYENIGERFVVTAGTGMTVNVGSGRALVKSRWIKNDATITLNLDPADVQLPRIDTIVLRYNAQENERNINIVVVTGTPAESPTFSYQRGENVYDLVIATVRVNKNATQIVQSNITDRRSSSLCGWVTGIIQQVDTSDLFLQWQSACEDYYASMTNEFDTYLNTTKNEFETWFNSLTQTLNVDTSIVKYQNTVTVTDETDEIEIGISEYDPQTDVLFAYVGGILLVENDEYAISGTGSSAKITLVKNLKGENDVTFIVLKNMIGSSALTVVEYGYLPDQRYFITPIVFDGTGLTSYEICICFRATVHPTRANAFCGGKDGFYKCPSCEMNAQGIWHGFAYSGGSPWQYNELVPWADMPVEIDFTGRMQWIKLSWDSMEQKQVLSHSLDGLTFTEISSFATPPTAFIPSGNADKIVLGNVSVISADHPFEVGNDINLYNSYIKMNGALVFGREVTA